MIDALSRPVSSATAITPRTFTWPQRSTSASRATASTASTSASQTHLRHPGLEPGSRFFFERQAGSGTPGQARGDGSWLGWVLTLLVALCVSLLPAPSHAQSFPQFTGLVTDAANILPADRKAALEQKLEAFQQQTGRQLVVATIPDLQGYPIEDYGYRLGRSWGVGLKGADNGAILIVAPAERKVRIEVGYKLEPVLTDAFSSVVIQSQIVPAFKAGDMPGGIEAGVNALIQQLSLPDDQAKAETAKAAAEFDKTHKRHQSGGFPLGVIIWLVIMGVIVASHFGRRTARGPWGNRRYDQGGSNWPIWLWAASEMLDHNDRRGGGGGFWGGGDGGSGGGGSDGGWGGGGFTGGGGGGFGGGGASGSW